MIDIWKTALAILKIVIPIGAGFAIWVIAAKMLGWWDSFNEATKQIFSNPIKFFFGLIIAGVLAYAFFGIVWPMITPYLGSTNI